MLKDILHYIKYKVEDTLSERKDRKKRKEEKVNTTKAIKKKSYVFQKAAIIMAAILWLFAAGNVLWKSKTVKGENDIIEAFSGNTYSNLESSIIGFGKYGAVSLTENSKQIILEKVADEIGINRYTISTQIADNRSIKHLSQESINGDVDCKFITLVDSSQDYSKPDQYLYISVALNNGIDSTFTYEKIIKKIMNEMEIDAQITVNIKGCISGRPDDTVKEALVNQILSKLDAQIQTENKTEDYYTIYAYDKEIKDYILIGSSKVNINISMCYNEETDMTEIYFSTPINNQDY